MHGYLFQEASQLWYWDNKKKTPSLSEEDEDSLWESGILSCETAKGLLNCVFFYNGKTFCLHGGQEHRELKLSQLRRELVKVGGAKKVRYVYTEHGSKNNQSGLAQLHLTNKIVQQYESTENPERCHVRILDLYLQKNTIECL